VRFLALATDYDGTLATDGAVDRETVAALRRLAGIDAVKAYLRLREAVSFLSEIHGHQYQEELVARL